MNEYNDPRSYNYERVYNKVPINKKRFFLIILVDLIISVFTICYFHSYRAVLLMNFIYYILLLKYFLIFIIKIYQKVAPISLRSKCRFEPSCSNYMLQALEKYGLIVGLKKGINRLKKCNVNDGGYDYP